MMKEREQEELKNLFILVVSNLWASDVLGVMSLLQVICKSRHSSNMFCKLFKILHAQRSFSSL